MKIDFNRLKTDISLPDFLLKFGWKFTVGSSRTSPKMTDGVQTIVIKKNSAGQYTYWDVHNETIRGKTIIDFMQQHLFSETGKIPSLREAGVILQGFIDNKEIVLPEKSQYTLSDKSLDSEAISALLSQLKPYRGDFLQKRGINPDTLTTPTFINTFFSRYYRKDDAIYYNTCIRMINEKGCQGISQRNESFKGIIGSHYDCIAASSRDTSRPIDEMLVGESMIDCISHYQMKHLQSEKNLLYISTEGTLTESQTKLIQLIITKNNINNLTTIFDNDRNGYLYTIKLNGFLKNEPSPENLSFKSTEQLKEIATQYNTDLSTLKDWNDDLQQILIGTERKSSNQVLSFLL